MCYQVTWIIKAVTSMDGATAPETACDGRPSDLFRPPGDESYVVLLAQA